MTKNLPVVLYVVLLVVVIVGLDVLFFRNRFRERLMVNIGIVGLWLAGWLFRRRLYIR